MSWTIMLVTVVAIICGTGLLAFIIEKICRAVEQYKNHKHQKDQIKEVMGKII